MTDLVIITGFSGAGKSTAMAAFEDEGHALDNANDVVVGRGVECWLCRC